MNDTPIVLAFTPNYLVPAATCILSILDHVPAGASLQVICLLTEPLPAPMKVMLESLREAQLTFTFINLEGRLAGITVQEKFTIAASYRLLLPDLLPQYEKVIYIDCDVIVKNDLVKLYQEIDLQDNYLAGVVEATLESQVAYVESIGCEPGAYINSGLLVMNLKLLRQDQMVPRFIEASKSTSLQFQDQDVLNQLCKWRIMALPPYQNSIRTFFLPQYKADFLAYYSEKDLHEVITHGTVHYTGPKPWNTFTIEFGAWWEYYWKLPAEIRQHAPINKKILILATLYRAGPGRALINTAQKYYRRLKN